MISKSNKIIKRPYCFDVESRMSKLECRKNDERILVKWLFVILKVEIGRCVI